MDNMRELAPRFLVCNVDARNGRGLAELDTYRKVAEALLAPIVMEIVLPDEVDADTSLSPIAAAIARAALPLSAIVLSSAADLKSWQRAPDGRSGRRSRKSRRRRVRPFQVSGWAAACSPFSTPWKSPPSIRPSMSWRASLKAATGNWSR
jgi:hypothetical protein